MSNTNETGLDRRQPTEAPDNNGLMSKDYTPDPREAQTADTTGQCSKCERVGARLVEGLCLDCWRIGDRYNQDAEFIISVRSRNALRRVGIDTVGQLLCYMPEQLIQARNCGPAMMRELALALHCCGIVKATAKGEEKHVG